MRERALVFGETNDSIGILSVPESFNQCEAGPAVILLNAGIIHRVGPHRLYVKLARTLAEAGFLVFRFDLSGIGDSRVTASTLDYQNRVISETKQAMTFLTSTERVERFILLGLCSGANNSIRVACADERVVGAALIDSYFYASTGFSLQGYRRRIFNRQSWQRFLSGKSDIWSILNPLSVLRIRRPNRINVSKSRHKMISELTALRDKNVRLFLIYTRDNSAYHKHRRSLKKLLASPLSPGNVQIKYFEQSDHIFTLLWNQQLLVDSIHDWAKTLRKDASIRFDSSRAPILRPRSGFAHSNETA